MTTSTSLTDHDRQLIAQLIDQAHTIAGLETVASVEKHTGETDILVAYVEAFREARGLAAALAAALERCTR